MDYEVVVANGTVIDGSGAKRFRADLGLSGGRIATIARGESLEGAETIDASGLIVAPGFIDAHSHADWLFPLEDHDEILAPLLQQGVTTVVAGQCGFSPAPVTAASQPFQDALSEMIRERDFDYRWRSMGEFLDAMASTGLLLNAAFLVGHGALRLCVLGNRSDAPAPSEMEALRARTRQALRDGAIGLSAGLAYAPGIFARNDELLELLRVVAEEGAVFTVHGWAYSWVSHHFRPMIIGTAHNIRSVRDLIALARRAGARLQLSHQIFAGRRTWRTHRKVLREIDRAADSGMDIAFDAFPYTFGNTTINAIFPGWFLDGFNSNVNDPDALRRLKREMDLLRVMLGIGYADIVLLWACKPELAHLEGRHFAAIARLLGVGEYEAYMHVARESAGRARVLLGTYSGDGEYEVPLQAALAHPLCAFETDTILTRRGKQNPASFGTFPRILGRYSRDLGLFPLEEAVRRMTGFSAEKMGLEGAGRIEEGAWADLVLFDADTVDGHASLRNPSAPPVGIEAVLMAGQVVVKNGQVVTGKRLGRVLRRR